MTCVICLEEIAKSTVTCSTGHSICQTCVEPYVDGICSAAVGVEINGLGASQRKTFGRVVCPLSSIGCAAPPFEDAVVTKALSSCGQASNLISKYIEMRSMVRVSEQTEQAFVEAQEALQTELAKLRGAGPQVVEVARDAGKELLARQLRKSMPNARQCRQCSWGPMDFRACSDLSAHHMQVVGHVAIGGDESNMRQVVVDNSCPRCGWFSKERRNWPKWDGVIHDETVLPSPWDGSDRAAREWFPKVQAAEKKADECRARAKELEALLEAADAKYDLEVKARCRAESEYLQARKQISSTERACLSTSSKVVAQLERERALRRAAELKLGSIVTHCTKLPPLRHTGITS